MKIIQLNIWFGHLMHPALKFVTREQPDILCVQEVLSSKRGVGLLDYYQTHERISELLPYQFFAPTFSFEALGETMTYGNAIYSKSPIGNEAVTFTCGSYKNQVISSFESNVRNLQICEISTPSGVSLTIANHHGFHDLEFSDKPEAMKSIDNVVEQLNKINGPLVLCADLNALPTSKVVAAVHEAKLRDLSVEAGLATTLSSVHRFDQDIVSDYIFVNQAVNVQSFRVADDLISDHQALILEIEA